MGVVIITGKPRISESSVAELQAFKSGRMDPVRTECHPVSHFVSGQKIVYSCT